MFHRGFAPAIVIVMVMVVLGAPGYFAHGQSDEEKPGILPDSPFYAIKIFGEKIRGIFIFSKSAEIKFTMDLAERRLKETEALAGKGKPELAAKTLERYQAFNDRIDRLLFGPPSDKKAALERVIKEAREKHIPALERALEGAPDQAKDIIRRTIERERAKLGISPLPALSPTPTPSPVAAPCVVTGCSGQVCAGKEVITTCEFKTEYACYRTAKCERQSDGQCGWTMTPELKSCLLTK